MGSLARIALPEVLKRIALNELSGCIEVTSARIVRTIYLDRGFVVFAASSSEADRLGQLLLESGRIDERELELACSLMQGKRRIGAAIVEAGLLTEEELGRELARQVRRIATAVFGLEEGMYRFDEGRCPIPMELRLGLSIYRIQLEGIREMKSQELVTSALPSRDTLFRLSQFPPFSFEDVRFLPEELLVMEAAKKDRSAPAILSRAGKDRNVVQRAIYGLLCAGILEPADESAEARPLKVQEETGTFLLSGIDSADVRSDVENVRQEVLLEYESSERAAPADLLEVDPSAEKDAIQRAYDAKQAAWAEKQRGLDNEQTLCLKVEEIQRRLAKARAELLESESPVPEPPPEMDATVEEEPSVPPRRAAGKTSDKKAELKRLFNEIKLRKMVEDSEGVISLMYEVVQLEPERAKYEAMLAQSLASHPVMKNKAERHFRRALSMDPQNADIHYLLGRYYQSFDMKSRALAEFKIALRIDPTMASARSAVVELKGSDEGGIQDRLKKIFG